MTHPVKTESENFDFLKKMGRIEWVNREKKKLTWADMDTAYLRNVEHMISRKINKLSSALWDEIAAECSADWGWGCSPSMEAELNAMKSYQRKLRIYISLRETHFFILKGPK